MHGFPPSLTTFVGRSEAVSQVAQLLAEQRLVTVTGPGGAGKTRLAGEVARQVAGRFADGVWLAELASVSDPALVAGVVAAALGLRDLPGVPTAEAVARLLARQELLLVLDNCEHVTDAAASLCAGLLLACDDVRVLVTSREPLQLGGEARYRLAPMTVPAPGDSAEAATASEAVTLFADRARRADAHFALTPEITPAVGQLVTRLDGMPLAIELAAARTESLGVTQLLDRIDDRFELMVTSGRQTAGRQRSLAATVQWSYQLLDEDEQRTFRALSVFPGPFTLAAAEALAGAGATAGVLRLVDCSLLSPPRPDPDGRWRYSMLETLRAYGAGLLATTGEQDKAAGALAAYALGVAEQAAAGLQTGTGEVAAANWLDAEYATTRQALAWARQHDLAIALRLTIALAPWWMVRGRLASQSPLLREAAGHATAGSDEWCAAQYWLGLTALFTADLVQTLACFDGIRDAIAGRPPSRAMVDCLRCRSAALANLGRAAEAADDARRSLAMARELGDPAAQKLALGHLAGAVFRAGDLDRAVQLAWQAEQAEADVPGWISRLQSNILAIMLAEAGESAAAERVCTAALGQSRSVGDPWNQARLLVQLATLDLQAARNEDAAAHLREALELATRTGDQFELRNALDCCAHLCAATGRNAAAVTLWAAHAEIVRSDGYTYPPWEARRQQEYRREARQALGSDQARAAAERGAAMSRDAAREYALLLTAPGSAGPPAAGPPAAGPPAAGPLSVRERELVVLVARGCTNAQIAAQLHISVRTVTSHLDRIRDKTGCRRRADLTRLALTAGLI